MARIAGRRGRIYMGATNGAVATPVTAQASWNINYTQDSIDVTALGDSNKQYVAGLADAGGGFNGFYDDSVIGTELLAAATDGLARKFYLYPDTSSATKYFHGEIVVSDATIEAAVDGAATASVTWKAAAAITPKFA